MAGWARFAGGERDEPYVAYVSNYHRIEGERVEIRSIAQPDFKWFYRRLEPGEGGYLETVGGISKSAGEALSQQLALVDEDALAMIGLLVGAVREEADRRESVGRGVMVNVLPRLAIPDDSHVFTVASNVVSPTHLSFVSLSHQNVPDGFYGPIVVGDQAMFSDFRAAAADGGAIPFATISFNETGFALGLPQGAQEQITARVRHFPEFFGKGPPNELPTAR